MTCKPRPTTESTLTMPVLAWSRPRYTKSALVAELLIACLVPSGRRGLAQIDVNPPAGVYGYSGDGGNISTPNLAKFASEGLLFQTWYSTFHVCTPSRASMLTGRLPVRLGIGAPPCDYAPHAYPASGQPMCNGVFTAESVGGLPLADATTAEVLSAQGWSTAMFGKWQYVAVPICSNSCAPTLTPTPTAAPTLLRLLT